MIEGEMREFAQMLSSMPGAPKSIQVTVRYDETLRKITGCSEEPACVNEGLTFLFFLDSIFDAYPEMMRRYPPGTIAFAVNGFPPRVHSPLFDGDVIEFSVSRRG